MKYVFGIDTTKDENNEITDGASFIVKELSEEKREQITEAGKLANVAEKKTEIKPSLKYTQQISSWVAIFSVLAFIMALSESKLTLPMAITFSALCAISVIAYIMIYRKIKAEKAAAAESTEVKQANDAYGKVISDVEAELEIPSDAVSADVLSFVYSIKDGTEKVYSRMGVSLYMNTLQKLYIRDNKLNIADLLSVVAIPLDEIVSVTAEARKISMPWWNKKVPFNADEYKEYRIRPNRFGMLSMNGVCIINIRHENEDFQILLPGYEEKAIRSLLGK